MRELEREILMVIQEEDKNLIIHIKVVNNARKKAISNLRIISCKIKTRKVAARKQKQSENLS